MERKAHGDDEGDGDIHFEVEEDAVVVVLDLCTQLNDGEVGQPVHQVGDWVGDYVLLLPMMLWPHSYNLDHGYYHLVDL